MSMSSSSAAAATAAIDRANNLKRGAACLACRKRKTRCDGLRPVCTNCLDKNRAEDCEYTDGNALTPSQLLEDNIRVLEARIAELQVTGPETQPVGSGTVEYMAENASGGGVGVALHQPYIPILNAANTISQELPQEVIQELVDTFIPFSSEVGFFLHVPRFLQMVSPSYIVGSSKVTPALLYTVLLWGFRLTRLGAAGIDRSSSSIPSAQEQALRRRAIQACSVHMLSDASDGDAGTGMQPSVGNPRKVVEGIQADILLAYYFLAEDRAFEADRYITSAIATALYAGLHQIRGRSHAPAANECDANPGSGSANDGTILPPPRDPIEEGERILAVWTVFLLDKMVAMTSGQRVSTFVSLPDRPDRRVDVPWPMEMADYEQGALAQHIRTERTIARFLNREDIGTSTSGTMIDPNSNLTLLAKAAFLWERAVDLGIQGASMNSLTPQHQTLLMSEIRKTLALLDDIKSFVPSPEQFISAGSVEDARRRVLWASVLHIATIRLYEHYDQSADSSAKVLSSAVAIFDIVAYTSARNLGFLNVVIGDIWLDASKVLASHIAHLRTLRTIWNEPSDAEMAFLRRYERGVKAMRLYTDLCPMINYKVSAIREALEQVRP